MACSHELKRSITKLRTLAIAALVFVLLPLAFARDLFADDHSTPSSFVNDVIPLLTKSGCNSGICHAKAGNGQNGFRL
jgi:hypothetical protein